MNSRQFSNIGYALAKLATAELRLLCPWARHLAGLPLPMGGWTGGDRWRLDSRTAAVTSQSPGGGALTGG